MTNVRIVLVGPKFEGNIGAVCRSMANFGLDDLVLVNPCPIGDDAYRRAKHGSHLLDSAKVVDTIAGRHQTYNLNLQEVFALERAGTAFVLAPSEPIHVSTYSMKEEDERALYDLGLQDFAAQKEKLQDFLSD